MGTAASQADTKVLALLERLEMVAVTGMGWKVLVVLVPPHHGVKAG